MSITQLETLSYKKVSSLLSTTEHHAKQMTQMTQIDVVQDQTNPASINSTNAAVHNPQERKLLIDVPYVLTQLYYAMVC
jgi:hypothetical protein